MLIPYEQIEKARNRLLPYIRHTPLLPFQQHGSSKKILLKCENLQLTGSFKIRGAANCILENIDQAKKSGVVTASAGNHAQGVAAICHSLGIPATIVMPVQTPPIKVQNTQRWGATTQLFGSVYDESFEQAMLISKEKGFLFIHPFRDERVMAGQGTIGLELLEDPHFKNTKAIVISAGGGGLITGIASVLRIKRPDIKIYAVTALNAPALFKSFQAKTLIEELPQFTLAEGVSTKKTDTSMLGRLHQSVDQMLQLSEESIAHAIASLSEQAKLVVEGAGALGVAAVLEGMIPENDITVVLSGGNIDLPALSNVLQRGLVEQGRLVRLVVTIGDRPGALHSITGVFAELGANIVEVYHQRATLHTKMGEAEIEVDLETRGADHTEQIIHELLKRKFNVQRLS